jgi:hypothetical protein
VIIPGSQKKVFLPLAACVVAGATACSPHLPWNLPVVVSDVHGPVAGVEVAIEGRFVGVTDAQGKMTARFEAPPRHTTHIEVRAPGFAAVHLPKSIALELPSLWKWALGADLQGASTLPFQGVDLDIWAPEDTLLSTSPLMDGSEDSLQNTLDPGVEVTAEAKVESDLPDEKPEVSARNSLSAGALSSGSPALSASPSVPVFDPSSLSSAENAGASLAEGQKADGAKGEGSAKTQSLNEATRGLAVPAPERELAGSDGDTASVKETASAKDPTSDASPNSAGPALRPSPGASAQADPPASLVVEAFSDGKPLAATQVYSIRQASGRVVKLGETDAKGRLVSRHPAGLLGESLLVRNPCCVSLLRPLAMDASGKSTRSLRVDLAPGVSHDFVAVQTSYGHSRVVSKVALQRAGRTLDVTGPAGVAIVRSKNLASGLAALDVGSAETVPPRKALALEIGGTTTTAPHLLEVALARPRLPQVGFLELAGGDVVHAETNLRGEPFYRRARRDFLSRFVQEKALRPLIFQEVKKIADAVGTPLESWMRRGWDLSAASGEIDFLVALESKGPEAARMRLVDAAGTVLWDETFSFGPGESGGEAAPELAGKAAFEGLLKALPFEFVAKAVEESDGSGTRVELEASPEVFSRGVLGKGDVFQRVAMGEPCGGTLQRDGPTLLVQGACAGGLVVGETFRRMPRSGFASQKSMAKPALTLPPPSGNSGGQ